MASQSFNNYCAALIRGLESLLEARDYEYNAQDVQALMARIERLLFPGLEAAKGEAEYASWFLPPHPLPKEPA